MKQAADVDRREPVAGRPPRRSAGPVPTDTLLAIVLSASLTACGGGAHDMNGNATPPAPLEAQAALGEKIFHDTSLSASGRQSCGTCHVESSAHGSDNALAAQFGGPAMDRQGARLTPSIRYLSTNTAFFFDAEGTPTGGFFWDGRSKSLADQAGKPFLNPVEMANTDEAAVVARLARAAYVDEFRTVYGAAILDDVDAAFQRITLALQAYQLQDAEFRPFDSKYDAFLRGQTPLSAQELRGLALFNSPLKGNCAACHPSARGADGSMPLFTDFSYDNLGLPRNPELGANADPTHFDLGLCARDGADMAGRKDLCGAFKVPSLRNVARRQALFHNGVFKSLKTALTFYVQRDTHPEKWYPMNADGSVNKFDDLPREYHVNVNTTEAPYNRRAGGVPALSDAEIDDVIAFLQTLNDGFRP
jgi:cytochrome c peroxidase